MQIRPFLPASLLTATMCVNSAEKSFDTTAFVASWMVAVEVENNVGGSFLTTDVSKSPEDNFCTNTSRKGNLSFVGSSIVNSMPGNVVLSSCINGSQLLLN